MKSVRLRALLAAILFGGTVGIGTADTITIMPLGDSITDGYIPDPGSYRTQLYTDLTGAGVNVNFVGSQTDNPSTTLTNAAISTGNPTLVEHEGHSGYRVDQIASNLDGVDSSGSAISSNGGYWLAGGNGTGRAPAEPNIITLLIGTNDITQGYQLPGSYTTLNGGTATSPVEALETRLAALVAQIVADRPNAELFVASLPAINDNYNPGNPTSFNPLVQDYNSLIQNVLVPRAAALGEKVYFVNQYANFVNSNGSVNTSLYGDYEHPNTAGGVLMGNSWFQAIEAVPEPSSVVLAMLGAAMVFGCYQLKRRALCKATA